MAIKQKDLIAKSTSSCEAEMIASSEALQQGENISIVISEMINTSCDIEVSNDIAAALGPVWIRDSMENPSHQCQSTLVASNVEKRNQVDVLGLGQDPSGMIESKPSMDGIRSPDPRKARMPGHGKAKTIKMAYYQRYFQEKPERSSQSSRSYRPK